MQQPIIIFDGPYTCDYCEESCAYEKQVCLLAASHTELKLEEVSLNFCTPECAAAFNQYTAYDSGSDQCRNRHALLERVYGRRIIPGPPPKMIRKYNFKTGMKRNEWLERCRQTLTKEELEVSLLELTTGYTASKSFNIASPIKK